MAPGLDDDQVLRLFLQEREPAALLLLGVELAERFNKSGDRRLLGALMERAQNDSDPLLRAKAVACLKHVGSAGAESLAEHGVATYDELILDPAPEVREQVVENLWDEHTLSVPRVRATGLTSLRAAAATGDPALATRLVENLTLDSAGPEETAELDSLIRAGRGTSLRAAAAKATGSLPATQRDDATAMLLREYRRQSSPELRRAILAALVRLHFASAVPILQSLRGVDPGMQREIDKWLVVLAQGRQQWYLLQRQKQWLDEQG
jgi:HEAT repeat protein